MGKPLVFGLKRLLEDPPEVCKDTEGSRKSLRKLSLSNEHKGESSSAGPPKRVILSSACSSVSSFCSKA